MEYFFQECEEEYLRKWGRKQGREKNTNEGRKRGGREDVEEGGEAKPPNWKEVPDRLYPLQRKHLLKCLLTLVL